MKRQEKMINGLLIYAFALEAVAQKYPLKVTAEAKSGKAEIKISGAIYDWANSSDQITKSIDGFLSEGITDVDVYLNSPGGDVFQASEILNQIQRFTGKKTGIGGAIVASAASDIAISLDSFEMAENGQFMYHKPSAYLSGNEDVIGSSLKLLTNLTSQYKKRLADKSGMTEDEIEANWSKGDVWLTAQEARDANFITGVIKKTTISHETKAMFEACGSPIVPKVNDFSKQQEPKPVDEPAKITAQEVDFLAKQLLVDKKINANQFNQVKALLKSEPKNTMAFFGLKQPPKKLSDLFESGIKAGRESWTLDEWRKNDPQYLSKNPDFYQSLVDKEFQS